ncbi:MAG TPA: hypothetical protein VFM45_00430, partial [Anaeromyxobacteraceae bacterium]|nr:hypothetical protein [Anaeromyxobacteraceae bacterium]
AEAEAELGRLRAALDLPTAVLPLLAAPWWGPSEVARLADALGRPRSGEPAWAPKGLPGGRA